MLKINGKVYRNLQEQVGENANNIEKLFKTKRVFYHKCSITYTDGTTKTLGFHFMHYFENPMTKKEFIEYIKKVKLIGIDINDVIIVSDSGYVPISIGWPVPTDDNLVICRLYIYNVSLDADNVELNSESFAFEDEIIDI